MKNSEVSPKLRATLDRLKRRRYEWELECRRAEPREPCPNTECRNGRVEVWESHWVTCQCSTCHGKGYLNGTETYKDDFCDGY